jgi:transcriptional regulator with XRE-family HTH domain
VGKKDKEGRSSHYEQLAQHAGDRVRIARERARMTQEALATSAGLSPSTLSRFEAGKNLEMSVGRFFDMCATLKLDPVYVWTGEVVLTHLVTRRSEPPPALVTAPPRAPSEPPPASVKRPSRPVKG